MAEDLKDEECTVVNHLSTHNESLYIIERHALTLQKKHENFNYNDKYLYKNGILQHVRSHIISQCHCSLKLLRNFLIKFIPVISWLPKYNIKLYAFGDLIAGITVAVMHIPQGMAYALLARMAPINGIYTAFFPVLIYFIFSTSRHCSMGTFAVVSLMTGEVVGKHSTTSASDNHSVNAFTNDTQGYSVNEVVVTVAFAVGVWELILGILHLGVLSVFLSDMLVSGFTTGAAVHVFTSQVKHLFGISVKNFSGCFKLIYTYIEIFSNIFSSNVTTIIISAVCITSLVICNEILKPLAKKCTRIPIPGELIAVVVGTLSSYFGYFNERYKVIVVGKIPTGLPAPVPPPFQLFGSIAIDAFTIAVVAFTVSFSMAKIFAKKNSYYVDAQQELYAQGLSNVFGSFFTCLPISASLSRSLLQEAVGGKTQIASVISCSLLLLILLFVGPAFESLPNCILASIIVVALKGMFMQVLDMTAMWKISKLDALIWLLTFLSVVLLDISYGLIIGVAFSLLILLRQNQKLQIVKLGHIPETEIYLDMELYATAAKVPKFEICQISGVLHFANCEYMRYSLFKVSALDPNKIVQEKKAKPFLAKKQADEQVDCADGHEIMNREEANEGNAFNSLIHHTDAPIWLVIDLSNVTYVDVAACNMFSQLMKEYSKAGILLCIAGISDKILQVFEECKARLSFPSEHIFHSVHDAVILLKTSREN